MRIGKKGVTVIPKRLRSKLGVEEGAELKIQLMPNGILLIPKVKDPVGKLVCLPVGRLKKPSVSSVRELREKIDRELRVR